jgi:hypothetical protein
MGLEPYHEAREIAPPDCIASAAARRGSLTLNPRAAP